MREALEAERPLLLPLPENPYPVADRHEAAVGKTPYVRYDGNDYSVPPTHVRRTLCVLATQGEVRILDGATELARHRRSYDARAQIEDPAHLHALLAFKRRAKGHRGMDRLAHAAPASRALLERLAERGKNLGYATYFLLRLLSRYGAEALEGALLEVLRRDVPHVHAVRQVLEIRHAAQGRPPALDLALPAGTAGGDLTVRPHDLSTYDFLAAGEPGGPDGSQPED